MNAVIEAQWDRERVADFCRRWHVSELALFGSVLREDFRPDSDIDVLVTFDSSAKLGLLDFVRAKIELSKMLGRKVDLHERQSVERSENWIRREAILSNARSVYVAR